MAATGIGWKVNENVWVMKVTHAAAGEVTSAVVGCDGRSGYPHHRRLGSKRALRGHLHQGQLAPKAKALFGTKLV